MPYDIRITMKISELLILSWSVLGLLDAQSPAVTELKLIQVIFRHGQRAPSYTARAIYPLDPYVNETWYPEGWGGLNNYGKQSAYDLGVFLRERYGEWLGNVYLEENVHFRSSNISRVIMSTQLVAAGLFPPSIIQRWNSNLNWQPIPVYVEADKINIFNLCKHMCPKHKAMLHELTEKDAGLRRRTQELAGFFELVSRNVGTNVGYKQILDIYSQLNSEFSQNLELPEWTRGIFPEGQLEQVAAYQLMIQSYNKSMIKMNGAPWISMWLKNVDSFLNGSKNGNGRGLFYGGHDATVSGILAALGVFQPHVPFYNNAVIFELSEARNEFYVKVLYKNRDVLQELLIPGCDSINCPLAKFRQSFADVMVKDPIALCQMV